MNQYYTLTPREGWTQVKYTDEGTRRIRNAYNTLVNQAVPQEISARDLCEELFPELDDNVKSTATHQIQVVLGRAYYGN